MTPSSRGCQDIFDDFAVNMGMKMNEPLSTGHVIFYIFITASCLMALVTIDFPPMRCLSPILAIFDGL